VYRDKILLEACIQAIIATKLNKEIYGDIPASGAKNKLL
jgi:hypothetical protein